MTKRGHEQEGRERGRAEGIGDLGEITAADRRAFAELVQEAYRVSEDVENEVEECLRLGREEPMPREDRLRLLEKIVARFMEVGEWPETGRSARQEAELIDEEAREAGREEGPGA